MLIKDEYELLITETEVAEILGVTRRTLQIWRGLKKGPRYLRIGSKTIRYHLKDVEKWLNLKAEGIDYE